MTNTPSAPVPDEAPSGAKEVGRSGGRGARRRAQLIAAGAELLGERGWAGLTSRAVAERAGTHAGLVHYHFGGLPALKREVAALVARQAFEPAVSLLTASPSWTAGVAAVVRASEQAPDERSARSSAELISASMQDPEIGELMRHTLADARVELVPWLRAIGAAEPEGLATLVVAALDGLFMHRLVDPGLPLEAVARVAEALGTAPQRVPPH